MRLRRATPQDRAFLVEMALLASALEDRPLPAAHTPDVIALRPGPDGAVIATDDDGQPVGAAWWHVHEPPLLCDGAGNPLPELVMAVLEEQRRTGIGRALVDAVADDAAEHFSALTLNVHVRNRAAHLYSRAGFTVAGAGRGPLGVAMIRPLASVRGTRPQ